MTTKSNWQAVHDQMTAEDRRRLGEPPTGDEVLAYMNGELSEAEEARVRALLVAYPELARTLTHPFPAEGEGEAFSEEELSKHFAELQERIHPTSGRVLPFRAASAALAAVATLALVFGGLLWDTRRELGRPRLGVEVQELSPEGRRGGRETAEVVAVAGQPFDLKISVREQQEYPAYRLDIIEESGRIIGTLGPAARTESETFTIIVPRGLRAGRYAVVLHGVDGSRERNVATYRFRVRAR
jgi:hypothetical protein